MQPTANEIRRYRRLIVVPCLNEEAHVGALLEALLPQAAAIDARIVVADGGSRDRTREIVLAIGETTDAVVLVDNPKRIQSAGINAAVAACGAGTLDLIRIDAHADYPHDYCERLVEEAERTGADSVVVGMKTVGRALLQRAVADAQNSRLGNGGSKHREGAAGAWVDHGHHALMRTEAFRAVGGYDETFSHNEDAELDFRLTRAGYRIWMTDRTVMTYYPRATFPSLFRQYLSYGRGRARNLLKHRVVPKVRQALPLLVAPLVAGALFGFLTWLAILPVALWMLVCLLYGAAIAVAERKAYGPLVGVAAMVMHAAWSLGFWLQLAATARRRRAV